MVNLSLGNMLYICQLLTVPLNNQVGGVCVFVTLIRAQQLVAKTKTHNYSVHIYIVKVVGKVYPAAHEQKSSLENGTNNLMVQIMSFDLLEIMRSLKSPIDLSRGSLKWLETSLHAGMPSYLQPKELIYIY